MKQIFVLALGYFQRIHSTFIAQFGGIKYQQIAEFIINEAVGYAC